MRLIFLYEGRPRWVREEVVELRPTDDPGGYGDQIKSDFYTQILKHWLREGRVDSVELVAITAWEESDRRHNHDGIWELTPGFTCRFTPNAESLFRSFTPRSEDLLFIRGNYPWEPFLEGMRGLKRFYYAANGAHPWPAYPVDALLVDSNLMKLKARFKGFRPHLLIKTADPEVFRPLNLEPDLDLVVPGPINQKKNQLALARLLDPAWEVAFVGNLDDAKMAREIEKLLPRTRLTGHVPRAELNRWLNRGRVAAIYAKGHDAAPRVILESMAAGAALVMPRDMRYGKKYSLPGAGVLAGRGRAFSRALEKALEGWRSFAARRVFEENFAPAPAAEHLWRGLKAPLGI